MKKLLLFIVIFVVVTGLNAKKLYLDAGIGSDRTKTTFIHDFRRKYYYNAGLIGSSYDYYTEPNLNFRLGYRLNDMLVFVSDIQSINISKDFYYQIEIEIHGEDYIWDYRMDINPLSYVGVGLIFYPHPRFQLGTTFGFATSRTSHAGLPHNSYPPLNVYYYSDGSGGNGYRASDFSVAFDIPIKKIGILIGCRAFYARMSGFKITHTDPPNYTVSSVGLFAKIRY